MIFLCVDGQVKKGRKVRKYRVPRKALVVVVNPDQNLAAPGSASFNSTSLTYEPTLVAH